MKKSLLALAVAALAAASSVSATTVYDKDGTSLGVYGRVQSVFYSGKASNVSNEEASINASGRLGVDLRTQLTSGVAGFALAEWEAANGNNVPDGNDGFDARYLWVGVDFGQFGKVKVGKFEEAIKYSLYATDIFDDWGCTGYAGNDDRREGVVQYQWSGNGLDAFISYAFAKDNEQLDGAYFAPTRETVDIDYSVSAAIGYTSPDVVFGPIAVRAGYIYGKFADGKTNVNNAFGIVTEFDNGTNLYNGADVVYDKYNQWALGASWGKLNIGPYVGVQYQARKFDVNYRGTTYSGIDTDGNYTGKAYVDDTGSSDYTVSGWEIAFGYSFANGVTVRTGYQTQNVDWDDVGADLDAKTVPVYVNYQINPQFNVWAEARFDAGTDDSADKNFDAEIGTNYSENVFSAGLRYTF